MPITWSYTSKYSQCTQLYKLDVLNYYLKFLVIFSGEDIFQRNSDWSFDTSERNDNPENFKYACPVCGKRFKSNSGLWQHKVIHIEAKPFECKYCGKGFKLKGNLRRHMITHYTMNSSESVVEPNTESDI